MLQNTGPLKLHYVILLPVKWFQKVSEPFLQSADLQQEEHMPWW